MKYVDKNLSKNIIYSVYIKIFKLGLDNDSINGSTQILINPTV